MLCYHVSEEYDPSDPDSTTCAGTTSACGSLVDSEPPLSPRDAVTRVLVTGGGGQLGREFALLLGDDAVALGRAELDVADEDSVAEAFTPAPPRARPALRRLDRRRRRGIGSGRRVARERVRQPSCPRAAHEAGAALVGFSTDYVFAGDDPRARGAVARCTPHRTERPSSRASGRS